jgi:crossover junction endodeoxyribonuclease RuvC
MNYFGGVDPGKTGALGIINEEGSFIEVIDWSEPPELWSNLIKLPYWKDTKLVVLEKVHSMPRQGVSSSFKFGTNFGQWQMALAALGVPHVLITPQRWRKVLDSSVPAKPEKEDLRQFALRRFPEASSFLSRKGDDGRAEALIMALWGLRNEK